MKTIKNLLVLVAVTMSMVFNFALAQTYTFTNAGATGRFGPTQAQCDIAYGVGVVNITTQGIQEWTVPATGSYSIEVYGAEGGDGTDSPNTFAGLGARIYGEFNFTAGQVIKILVGQQGGDAELPVSPCTAHPNRAGGGGGGSFVTDILNTPYIVAGGGNGDNWLAWNTGGPDGKITNTGTGGGTSVGRGAGGGGLIGNGQSYVVAGSEGLSFVNGGAGGIRCKCNGGDGGFGGGGGAYYEGGGAGGYTGGSVVNTNTYNTNYPNYGAGSYNSGINQSNSSGVRIGNGLVVITNLCTPTIITPDVASLPDVNASCSSTPTAPTAVNDCGTALTGTPDVVFPIVVDGTTVVTWTYDDGTNTLTQAQNVIVANAAPVAVCQNITVVLDAAGNYTMADNEIDGGSTDDCGITSIVASITSFTCADIGPNNVTLTITDTGGTTDNCVAVVTVQDNTAPTAIRQNFTVVLDATGNATIASTDINNGSNDACGIASLSVSPSTFTCTEIGANTVTLTVTDNNGNSSTCTSTVTVTDNIAPTAVCQDFTTYLDATGNSTITAADIDNGSSDICGVTLSASQTAFTCAEVGVNVITLSVTDPSGNVSTCTSNVTVIDTISPTAVCQDITIVLDASGNASILPTDIDNGSSDACGLAGISVSPNNFTCAELGANTVTFTALDNNGNSSTCTSTVTVVDNTMPNVVCNAITVQLDAAGNATIAAADIDGGSTDNCIIASTTIDVSTFDCTNIGANNVTLTVTDASGNMNSCVAVVTIQDNVAPVVVCQDVTIALDAAGNASIVAADIDGGSTDNCGIASVVASTTAFDCSMTGPNTVTLTVTDVNGNFATCNAIVTVVDNINPVITCPADVVVNNDPGVCGTTVTYADPVMTDNCGVNSVGSQTFNYTGAMQTFIVPAGVTSIDVDVYGGAGGTSYNGGIGGAGGRVQSTLVVVPGQTLNLYVGGVGQNGNNTGGPVLGGYNGGGDGNSVFSAFGGGGGGASDIRFTPYTLADRILVAGGGGGAGSDGGATNGGAGGGLIGGTAATATNGATIEASGGTQVAGGAPGSLAGWGVGNPGVLGLGGLGGPHIAGGGGGGYYGGGSGEWAGGAGGSSYSDALLASGTTHTQGVQNGNGIVTITWNAVGGTTLTQTDATGLTSGDVFPIGTTTLEYTATDDSGNTDVCTFNVTVTDNESPVAICQPFTAVLDATGNATITTVDINNGSTDNCGIASMSLDITTFNCTNVGPNTVTLTVTDVNGLSSTCTSTVTVQDNTLPTAICQDITVQLDATGNIAIVAADIDNGSNDICGIATTTIDISAFDCTMIGANTVTLTVTDNNGNFSTCTSTVTVEDNVAPTAICNNLTVQLDGNGAASITVTDIDNGSSDACGIASTTIDITTFDCTNVGPNAVTLTVTDVNGNISTCVGTVTVEDNIAPIALCNNITIPLDGTGNATITAADIDGGSVDNCGIASTTIDISTFDCSNVGTNTVTLTVTDDNGNISTCTSTVTVVDNIAPTAICQDFTAVLDGTGNATITAGDIDNGSNDICGIASLVLDMTAFDCTNVGANTVTLTVTDNSGNISTCTSTVTVQDNEVPVAACMDITVQLDASGNVSITGSDIDGGSTDNCTIASLIASPNTFTCADQGVQVVTLTVTDASGNISTCTANVTVEDNIAPVITCPGDITLDAIVNNCGRVVTYTVGVTENCATVVQTDGTGLTSGTLFPVGTTVQTYEITDATGTYTCTFNVTIVDNEFPVITNCPSNISVSTDLGKCDAIVSWQEPVASDNCPAVVFTSTFSPGDIFPQGTTTVTYTATDASGNATLCSFDVIVTDNEAPVIDVCPADLALDTDLGFCTATNPGLTSPIVTENCAMGTIVNDAPATFPLGNTVVTWTVTDAVGNISTCTQNVFVTDNELPIAICQALTIQLDATGNAIITAANIDNGSNDACGIASTTIDVSTFDCTMIGANTVTLTVTDNNGNVATCTSTVTVEDNVAPIAICQPITVQLDATGNVTITGADIDNGSSDACGIASMTASPSILTCAEVGLNVVTLTVTDNNGNVSTCTSIVTVEDNVAPIAMCQPITVQLDATGNATITPADIDNGSNDACGVSLAIDISAFDCSMVGTNIVTLTVTDANGNFSTCTSVVTVEDNIAPVAMCQPITVQLDATGNATITAADIDNGSNDACGITTSIDISAFDCSMVGANTVTLTVTDANGNVSTCTSIVTVEDNVAPVATCQPITVQLDATGNATITAADVDNGSSDACGIASSIIDISTFDCTNVGPNTVTLTVTDVNGNISTCTSVVTVEDNVAPIAMCQPITVQLDATGNVVITPADIDAGSNDACGITTSIDISSFDCSMVGANTVTLTVTDANGNFSTCTSVVTVEDNVAPIATCQPITVQLDATGNASIVPSDIDNGSNDACGIASLALDLSDFDCGRIGLNTVTLIVTDVNGNVSTCTSIVTVEDNVAPVALCQPITVQLDATGNAVITAADIDNGSTDACGIASTTIDVSNFDCTMIGANTVTLTVTDVNGNVSTCTSVVTVEDNVAPVALCQPITVQLDASGNASILVTDIDAGSTDACGIASTTIDISTFDCTNVGANTVTLTVTDVNGNVSICTSVVTVEDNVAPVAMCQPITVQLDATGNVSITELDIDNGSNDACGIASTTIDVSAFDCSNVGPNTVTLTVTDVNGNVSTCTSTVTVEDNVAPVAICQPITVTLDATGNATIVAADIDNGSNDACGIASLAIDVSAFDCSMQGPNTVTLTVTDVNGNVSTCTSIVTVVDNMTPVITCPGPVVVSQDPGLCTASSVALGMATATDNCTASVIITNDAPAVFPYGTTVVTWTATDANGNASSCTQDVTVNDVENPVITCPIDVTVSADAGNCDAAASGVTLGMATATDNCTIASITNDAPAVYPLGTTNVTWTATDVAGNTQTCTQIVTVIDTEAPMITCPIDVTVNTNPGNCAAIGVALGTPITSDNCMIASVTNNAPGIFLLGNTTVTWTVTDMAGNSSTCTQVVTVVDNELPTIACPVDVTANNDLGSCDATGVSLGTPITNDNCTVASVTSDAPSIFPLGNTTVTWTVTDAVGNTATCTQIVTVVDADVPTITCPIDVSVSADAGSCDASSVMLGTPITADNCSVASVTNDAPAIFPLGNTTVTWTVTDGAGNTAMCMQVVTVTDDENPIITCPTDITISASGGTCDATGVALGSPVTTDNCSVASVTNDAPVIFPLGNTTVIWTVTDGSGNSATCTQIVTVVDTEAPSITCPTDVIVTADAGICDASSVVLGTPITSDNCSVASVTNDAPVVFPLGNTTVIWTVIDGSGNTNTCTQIVTVTDNELPTIVCPIDVTVTADAGICDASSVVLGTPITNDNCSIASVTNDAPATFPLGTTTVTWTVVDGSGNSAICTQDVTVTDDELPTIVCPVDFTQTADAGVCGSSSVILGTPVTTDNCSVATVTNDAPVLFPVGTTTVTWTVIDGSGNTVTCTQDVTITDDEAPVVICSPMVAVNTDSGVCGATVSLAAPTSTDNCSIATVTNDAPVLFSVGLTTVTWTVTDVAGNTTTCTQDVMVTDNEAPTVTCTSDILVSNTPGYCGASVTYTVPQFNDNCGLASITQTDGSGYTNGNLFPVGVTYIEYTAVDNVGNVLTCGFNITVVDTEDPQLASCPTDITVYTTAANECGTVVTWVEPVPSDNCPGVVLTQSHFPGTYFGFGTTAVTYNAEDNNGNIVSCTFNVTVLDGVNPTISVIEFGGTLVADNANADSYQWIDCDNGNSPIAGATTPEYTPTSNGNYAVIITVDGCADTTDCGNVSVVGIEDVLFDDLVIYPNPSNDGIFNITYSGQIVKIDIVDMLGRIISLPISISDKVIDGSELASGKYMVRVYTDSSIINKEVVIVK